MLTRRRCAWQRLSGEPSGEQSRLVPCTSDRSAATPCSSRSTTPAPRARLAAWARDARRRPPTRWCRPPRTVLFDGVADPAACASLLARLGARRRCRGDLGLVEVPVTYDGPDLEFVAEQLGHRRGRGGRRAHTDDRVRRRRSAASRPGSPTSPGCPTSSRYPGWTRRVEGAGRVGGARRHLVRRLPDGVAGRLAAHRHAPTPCCGTRPATSRRCCRPGTRVRFVPR